MLEDTVKELKADGVPIKPAVSKVPIEDWVDLLEAGWRPIKETQFSYIKVSTSYKYPIGS